MPEQQSPVFLRKRYLLLALIAAVWLWLVFGTGIRDWLSLEYLQSHSAELRAMVRDHYVASIGLTAAVYFLLVASAIPGAIVLTIACGYLFGPWIGSAIAVVFGTLGTCIPFLVARYLLREEFHRKFAHWVERFEGEIGSSPFSYMLAARLNPVMPFLVANTVPGLLNISLSVYAIATFIGILPPSIALAQFGSGMQRIIATEGNVSITDALSQEFIIALFIASLLVLLPRLLRLWRKRQADAS